ncbi:MAG: ABC transporter ATP-binding protein [Acidimicrobiaceae bacterium]|nr:ABC transporter ATP-binding protein [Acidimicrobiaceae bacterium]
MADETSADPSASHPDPHQRQEHKERQEYNERGSVTLQGVTKRFGKTVAVEAIDLNVKPREFISLLGPSGCGKTTTLRMVSGFEEPTNGRILISGTDATGVPPHKRRVNTVFQSYALFEHMTVADNVAFGLRVKGFDKAVTVAKTAAALDLVRLTQFAQRRPAQLSGGQKQRVALARAIVNEPDVLLLDEPLSALDLKLRQAMRHELGRLHDELGLTFIFVTHDQQEAITMSDRIAVMDQGRIHQLGTPSEIYERPVSRFVADFIGETNMLEVTGAGQSAGLPAVTLSTGELVLLDQAQKGSTATERKLVLAVRPQRVTVTTAEEMPVPGGVAINGHMLELLFLGDSTRATVQLTDGSKVVALRYNDASRQPFGELRPGDAVTVGWAPGAACVIGD